MNEKLLTVAALLPAILLGIYIYKKDSAEKEPKPLLALLLFLGVMIVFPVSYLEEWVDLMIGNFFAGYAVVEEGELMLSTGVYYLYVWVKYTIGVALIEEGFKWLAMWFATSKNKNFNSLFDGIVYAVFVSLGFAAFENVMYCLEYGWATAIARFVTSVPAHTFFAIIMGYYYSNWHMQEIARMKEYAYIASGTLDDYKEPFSGRKYLRRSIVMPVLVHGFYDFCCDIDEVWSLFAFVILMIVLYAYCFLRVRSMSMMDGLDGHITDAMLLEKYPELKKTFVKGMSYDEFIEREREELY